MCFSPHWSHTNFDVFFVSVSTVPLVAIKCYLVVEEGPFVVDQLDLNSVSFLDQNHSAQSRHPLGFWYDYQLESSYPGRFLTIRFVFVNETISEIHGNTASQHLRGVFFFHVDVSICTILVPNVQTFQESCCLRL